MKYAQSSLIERQWEELAQALERIQREAMMAAALIASANDAAWHQLEGSASGTLPGLERREQLSALLRLGTEQSAELLQAIDAAFEKLAARATTHAKLSSQNEGEALVAAALDEATRVLDHAGTEPIVLLFDEEERTRLGKEPLCRLAALVGKARTLLGERSVLEAGESHQALSEAMELAELLGEGAKTRPWTTRYQPPTHYNEQGQCLVPAEETQEARPLPAASSNPEATVRPKPNPRKKRTQS